MKQDVFNQYAERIAARFEVSREDLFTKTKKREVVDARQLLYYLCHKRPMRVHYIQKYMVENGYDIKHSTIIHGINAVKQRIDEDADYLQVIRQLEKSVFVNQK